MATQLVSQRSRPRGAGAAARLAIARTRRPKEEVPALSEAEERGARKGFEGEPEAPPLRHGTARKPFSQPLLTSCPSLGMMARKDRRAQREQRHSPGPSLGGRKASRLSKPRWRCSSRSSNSGSSSRKPQNTSKQPKKQQEDVVDPFRRLISAIKKVVAKAEAAPDPLAYPLVDRLARVVQAAQAGRPVEKPKPASRRSAAKASNGSKEGGGAAGAQPKTAGGGRPPQQPQPPPTAGGQQTAHAGVVRGRGRRRRQEGEEAATTATMAKDSPAQQRSSQPARRAESGGLLAAGWPPAAVCASGRMLEALCEAKPPPGSVAVMSTEDADMATDLARTHWVKTTFAILVPGAEADEAEHPKARRFAVASADGVACGPFVVWPFVGEALPLFPPEPVVSTATVTARELLTVRFCGVRPCSFLGEFTGEASGRLTSRGGAADVAAPLR